jgi:hypothetical protein
MPAYFETTIMIKNGDKDANKEIKINIEYRNSCFEYTNKAFCFQWSDIREERIVLCILSKTTGTRLPIFMTLNLIKDSTQTTEHRVMSNQFKSYTINFLILFFPFSFNYSFNWIP